MREEITVQELLFERSRLEGAPAAQKLLDRSIFKLLETELKARGEFKPYAAYATGMSCTLCGEPLYRTELCAEVRSICCGCFYDRVTEDEREICRNEDQQWRYCKKCGEVTQRPRKQCRNCGSRQLNPLCELKP